MAIVDLKTYGSMISNVVSEAAGINNSYAATYRPWLQTIDPNSGEQVWVPASTMMKEYPLLYLKRGIIYHLTHLLQII